MFKTKSSLSYPTSWEKRCPVIHQNALFIPEFYPHQRDEGSALWQSWMRNSRFATFYLEICSGNGAWIYEKAKANPHICWIAVEKRRDRAEKIWRKAEKLEAQNCYVVCGDAKDFLHFYAPARFFSQIFINFPDPWPKARHAKHRLIQPLFIENLAKASHLGGRFLFVSDDFPYIKEMIAQFSQYSHLWTFLEPDPHYKLDEKDHGSSFFDTLWRSKGRQIYFVETFCHG